MDWLRLKTRQQAIDLSTSFLPYLDFYHTGSLTLFQVDFTVRGELRIICLIWFKVVFWDHWPVGPFYGDLD